MFWKEVIGATTFHVYHIRALCMIRISSHSLTKTVWSRFYCTHLSNAKIISSHENQSLLSNLEVMGVDIKMARIRQPGILKKMITHEESLKTFLQSKGANKETIASIISRYPRAITRTYDHLEKKWEIWKSILKTDLHILKIVERSPESFFRSGNIDNLEENITFLSSLGLMPKDISQLLTKAPRTFSNRAQLNKQMVDFLQDFYICLGGENPQDFVKQIITKNIFILIKSTKRLKANIDFLQLSLQLDDKMLLHWIQNHGVDILDLCNTYIKRNFSNAEQKLCSLGCSEIEIIHFIRSYPSILYLSPKNFLSKVDLLIENSIDVNQILENPRVLEVSIDTLKSKINRLGEIGYDYQSHGIAILALSQTRFKHRLERLCICK